MACFFLSLGEATEAEKLQDASQTYREKVSDFVLLNLEMFFLGGEVLLWSTLY